MSISPKQRAPQELFGTKFVFPPGGVPHRPPPCCPLSKGRGWKPKPRPTMEGPCGKTFARNPPKMARVENTVHYAPAFDDPRCGKPVGNQAAQCGNPSRYHHTSQHSREAVDPQHSAEVGQSRQLTWNVSGKLWQGAWPPRALLGAAGAASFRQGQASFWGNI